MIKIILPPDQYKTTISIKRRTKNKLKELGSKGDTYDDILNKMIRRYLDLGR